MIPTQETDHVGTARALLIEQFKNRTYIQGYLDVLARRCQELENVFWDIIDKRRLPVAVAHQLDMLGRLVNEKRLGRSDDDYRAAISLRIRVNRSKGRIVDIIDVAMLAAGAGPSPEITEYRYLGFEVDMYEVDGGRHIAELLDKTRAASSYGLYVVTDRPKSECLIFDDAVSPIAGAVTFTDFLEEFP